MFCWIRVRITHLFDANRGQVIVDLTTSDPARTRELARETTATGRAYLDCGMTGGAAGADAGTLTLMCGGDAAVLERVRPVFAAFTKKVFLVGPSGAGHTLKLIHNMVVHTNFLVASEACRMAESAGMDLASVIDVFNAGNARSFSSECHIISALPSITRPQPIENKVSPTKASLSAEKK